jgi:hypothetical protein
MAASFCAWAATALPAWLVPVAIPGGKPVTEVPGLTPTSPSTVVGPVFVTALPASTPKLPAVPRSGIVAPASTDMGTVSVSARVPSNTVTISRCAVRTILLNPFNV